MGLHVDIDYVSLFFILLFVHLLFDFCLQTDFMSKYKGKLPFVMTVHVFLWTMALIMTLFYLIGDFSEWIAIFLFAGHYFSDWYKIRRIEKENLKDESNPDVLSRLKLLFHIDQVWHIIQVLIVVIVL